jgi:hypothetical protein
MRFGGRAISAKLFRRIQVSTKKPNAIVMRDAWKSRTERSNQIEPLLAPPRSAR